MGYEGPVESALVEQFHKWETRGRGWDVYRYPIHLEPPFRPFRGHVLPYRPIPDDGRRPTSVSLFVDQLFGRSSKPVTNLPAIRADTDKEPDPRPLTSHELSFFDVHLPRELVVRPDLTHAALTALRAASHPIAYEVVGTEAGIAIQLAARETDKALLTGTLGGMFPEATFVPAPDRLDVFTDEYPDNYYAIVELVLANEFMLPIPVPRSFDPDPLIPLVAALEDIGRAEFACLQVLFEGVAAPWAESIIRAVTTDEGKDFFSNAPEVTALGKKKAIQPLFAVAARIILSAPTPTALERQGLRLGAYFVQFAAADRNELVAEFSERPGKETDVLRRESHRSGMLLGLDELAGLVHLPSSSVRSPRLLARSLRPTRAVPATKIRGVAIGENTHAGRTTEICLAEEDLRRHVHIVGASGSGKSNLILQLLLGFAREGFGFALLDPHGDLADDILTRLPEERLKDVVMLDPADMELPATLNILSAATDLERTLLASDLVGVFRRLSTSWGDQMHSVFANAIQAFLESSRGGSLADLRRFLVEVEFRKEFLETVTDEETVYYWKKEFPLLRGHPQGPILTRLDSFLRPKIVRRLVTGQGRSIDFREVMDRRGIVLAKLAQGAIGEENAALLGSFLTAKLHQVTLSRQDAAERPTFLLACDEFQHFVTPSMATLLSGARKFGVGLVLAHQDLRQVESRDRDVLASVLGNAGTRIVFRVSDSDARALADGFAHFETDAIRTLAVGEAIARVGGADRDFNLRTMLAEPVDSALLAARRARVTAAMRAKYASQTVEMPDQPPGVESLKGEKQETPVEVTSRPVAEPHREPRPPIKKKDGEPPTLGRGGVQHKYLQELVKRFAESKGYRATIEKPTSGGGSVDVALEREDGSIAVEISVTSTADYESGNVLKCLASGYARVVLLASDERRVQSLTRSIHAALDETSRQKVDIVTPDAFLTFLASRETPPDVASKVAGYNVNVSYRRPESEDAKARQRAIAQVVARSVRKLDDE